MIRRTLVTGASRGIGAAFARACGERGDALVLVARDTARLEELAAELGAAHGTDAEVLTADLTDPVDLRIVERRLEAGRRPVDLLVNNAGFGSHGHLDSLDVDRETAMIELNVIAMTRLSHRAAEAMTARGGGAIVNVSSILSFQPGPNVATYAAGKAFIRHLTEALHEELAGTGVRVMALCPGFTRTDIFEGAGSDPTLVPDIFWMTPDEVVATALRDLDRGSVVSVPGLAYKALALSSPRLPGTLVRRVGGFMGRFA